MLRWIVNSSLKFPFLAVAIAFGVMVFGLTHLTKMPVDVFPEFAPPRIEIQTECLGLSAAEVEQLVTVPLENILNGVPGRDVIRSTSVPQLSYIAVLFKQGTDLLQARQAVQVRLATVGVNKIPSWAKAPTIMPPVSATARVIKIGLSSKTLSLLDISSTAFYKMRPRLLQVPGVANVAIWGMKVDALNVEVDPQRLAANNVTLNEIASAAADSADAGNLLFTEGAVIGTGGFLETANQRMAVNHVLPVIGPADLAQVPIQTQSGSILKLSDVANVVEESPPLTGDAVINGGPGVMLVVEKLPWGNTLQVTQGVEDALNEMSPGLPGLEIDHEIFRAATFVNTAFNNLTRSLLLGILLVIIVLGFFLFEWRSALISAITIPLSLTAAIVVLYLRGTTINTMILAGLVIAIGAVVDDGIVDMENITRRLRTYREQGIKKSAAAIILEASLEVRGAVVYATFIEVAALIPVFFLTGLTGSFFRPLAISYSLAVLVSLVVALVVTPALSLVLLRKAKLRRRDSPLVRVLKRGFDPALGRIVRRPRWAYIVVAVAIVAGVAVVPFLGQSLFPTFKERDFLILFVTTPGTALSEEGRMVTQLQAELRAIPGVRDVGSHIGQGVLGEEIAGSNHSEAWVSIDAKANYDETLAAIEDVVAGYPGLFHEVLTYLNERTEETLTGAGNAMVVRIYGEDLVTLRSKAAEVEKLMGGIAGMVDQHTDLQQDEPHITVEVDLAAAQKYGLKPGDVRRAASTMTAGVEVGTIFRGGQAYVVNVWGTPEARSNPNLVADTLLDTPSGGHVRLGDIATVAIGPTPNSISRENSARYIDVSANVRGRSLGAVANDLDKALATVSYPVGYRAVLLGEYAERQAAQSRLLIFGIAAGIIILLLLVTAYGSWRLAVLTFVTTPMALVGGALAIYASHSVLSIGAVVGFFTVLGVVARNGIMMVTHFQHLEKYEGEQFGPGLVMRGASERLSPILMTALATAFALIPLVIIGDVPGQEIEYPMALVILGGLVTSTLLNLFVIPSLYLRFGKSRGHWFKRRPDRPASSETAAVDTPLIPGESGS